MVRRQIRRSLSILLSTKACTLVRIPVAKRSLISLALAKRLGVMGWGSMNRSPPESASVGKDREPLRITGTMPVFSVISSRPSTLEGCWRRVG